MQLVLFVALIMFRQFSQIANCCFLIRWCHAEDREEEKGKKLYNY